MHGQYGSSEMASCSPPTDSNSGVRTAATATIAGDSTRLSCREFGGKVRMQIGKEENLAKTWRKRRMLTLLSFVKVLTLDPADPPHHESMIAFGKIMCCMKRPALEKSRAGGMGKIYLRAGSIHVPLYMDMLDKKIGSLLSESDDFRVAVQSKDSSLQVERTKMEELLRKSEALEASSSQKDSQIGLLRPDRTSGPSSRSINLPGTSEIEQMNDKVHRPAVVTQIRGARKVNNDQVAIDVEMQKGKPLDDEDDDKAHGFKSLTMSHIVPKFTRPISDRIDGMWVSGDRLLMRQPTMRLGILIYWIALHALLASFI